MYFYIYKLVSHFSVALLIMIGGLIKKVYFGLCFQRIRAYEGRVSGEVGGWSRELRALTFYHKLEASRELKAG